MSGGKASVMHWEQVPKPVAWNVEMRFSCVGAHEPRQTEPWRPELGRSS